MRALTRNGVIRIPWGSRSSNYRCTYAIWAQMRYRCHVESHPFYQYYGGRGIKVCKRWQSFENFLADMGERPEGMSIDRIDNDDNYSKENCRWATQKEQMRNRRVTRKIEFEGKEYSLAELAERFNIHPCVLNGRIKRGWPTDRALKAPLGKNQYASTRYA